MIFYHTGNTVSQAVMRAFEKASIQTEHVANFWQNTVATPTVAPTPIFYGILRGTGMAMRYCQEIKKDFYYLDNGYFDAIYMDEKKRKDMSGKYRVVKNGMIEKYSGGFSIFNAPEDMKVLILPPSPYTAFMHDTTPEDWVHEQAGKCQALGYHYAIRTKESTEALVDDLRQVSAVLAFNSMSVMTAIMHGISAFDTHGVLQNTQLFGKCLPAYELDSMREFYREKDFTLDEIKQKGITCLKS